jgi:hypothetical protein
MVALVALTLLDFRSISTVRAGDAVVIPVQLKGGSNFTTVRIGDVDLKTGIDTGGWLNIAIAPDVVAKLRVRFTGTVTEANNGGGNHPAVRARSVRCGRHAARRH